MSKVLQIKRFVIKRFPAITITIVVCMLIVIPMAGLSAGEFLGNLGFTILLISVITDIAIIISAIIGSSQKPLEILWMTLGTIVPLSYFFSEGIGIIVGWEMVILSFPACLLIIYPLGWLAFLIMDFAPNIASSPILEIVQLFLLWLGCFILGYLQWFKLLPFIVNKIRSSWSGRDDI